MLKNYSELATSLKQKFGSISYWPEVEFNADDRQQISTIEGVTAVGLHTFQMRIDSNHCVIPGQYLLYAICVKELALEIKAHLDVFAKLSEGKSQNQIGEMIKNRNPDFSGTEVDEYSKKLAIRIFWDEGLNLDAKSLVNGSPGDYKIRSVVDFFGSLILKPINVPDASSGILGKLIFRLTENEEIYSYLENRFLNNIPYITKDPKINRFVLKCLSFLLQYDHLDRIKHLFARNVGDSRFLSIKEPVCSLTSIFRTSSKLLSIDDLITGEKPRFFEEPLYRSSENEFVYLSTEWTDERESRLDLSSFANLVSEYYPEFVIQKDETGSYFLKNRSALGFVQLLDPQIPFSLDRLLSDVSESGLQVDYDNLIRFSAVLATKPFVILTGLSGSGKTKLAQAFAMWICQEESQYCIVPVGADWTNREPLLGFPNALKTNDYVKPDNGALNLIIEASKKENSDKPYFLILDEMNLSHVERYFADFLSVMESKESLSLHSGDNDWSGVPSKIGFPPNLFIVGTVNIDETTYMFSPKVLDRANVIEFRVTKEEMSSYLAANSIVDLEQLKAAGAGMASDFLKMATDNSFGPRDPDALNSALIEFFVELQKTGAEFGYRSASEIRRFAGVVERLGAGWETNQIIDAALMQKLLPKVHGSRRKLESVLRTIGELCLIDKTVNGNQIIENYLTKPAEINWENVKYPLSFGKIVRMNENLIANSFTSYAEA